MTGLASGVKGLEAQLSFFYELLAAQNRDTMEIEPCVYLVSEIKSKLWTFNTAML